MVQPENTGTGASNKNSQRISDSNGIPPLTKPEIKVLAKEIHKAMEQEKPTEKYNTVEQFFKIHKEKLTEIVDSLSRLITGEEEHQHLIKFQRPLTREDIEFYSASKWNEARDVGDLIKLVPTAYFQRMEDEDYGYFKLHCYEGVPKSSTFTNSGLKVQSQRMLHYKEFHNHKGLRNAFTTFKNRLKERLWEKDNDFFDRYEAFLKTQESEKAERSREDKILRMKCLTVLKIITEQSSYKSFEREMYYLHNLNVDVGTVDQSTYFVDKCLETLALIVKKAIRDDFCKFDEVTQSFPDFSMAADGLTDQEKTGEAVVLTKFCGGRLVNFPVHLRKHKRSKNIGPDASGLLRHFELALGAAGIHQEKNLFSNLTSTVLDGSEQFKVEFPLMEKILEVEENILKRADLPEANIVEWCKAHSWELVAKDLIKLDPMVASLEKRVKALRRFFAFGKGADFLEDACSQTEAHTKNPKFLKLCKTRFSEHHLKAY